MTHASKSMLHTAAWSVERWDNQGHLEERRMEEGYQWSEKSDWISACFLPTPPGQEASRQRSAACLCLASLGCGEVAAAAARFSNRMAVVAGVWLSVLLVLYDRLTLSICCHFPSVRCGYCPSGSRIQHICLCRWWRRNTWFLSSWSNFSSCVLSPSVRHADPKLWKCWKSSGFSSSSGVSRWRQDGGKTP